MFRRNKKKKKDILEMPLYERTQLTQQVKERLRERGVESKLRQLLLEAEKLTIDGKVVYDECYLVVFPERLDTHLRI